MMGLGEHVDRLDFFSFVASRFHVCQVSCQGRRVARHVDDAFRSDACNGVQNFFLTTRSGGIDDNDIGFYTASQKFGKFLRRIAAHKVSVFHAVVLCVFYGVANGRFDDFNAVGKLGSFG